MSSFLDEPVRGFLDQLAARTPTPGGGGAAAVTGAMAAGLVAMAARFSATRLPEAGELADQADELRLHGGPAGRGGRPGLRGRVGRSRARASGGAAGRGHVPLEIAAIGARVAGLAVRVAEAGNPNLRGDAVTGAVLAAASARSAASLVDINVRLGGLDPELSRRAAAFAGDAASSAERVSEQP